jgi:hypothetical protein
MVLPCWRCWRALAARGAWQGAHRLSHAVTKGEKQEEVNHKKGRRTVA